MENPGLCLTPFQRRYLMKSLETDLRAEYRRRIEIMLLFDAGQSQTQVCEALGCSQETARYWIMIAQTGQAHKWSDRLIGRPKTVNQQYLGRLKELASHSPRDYDYSFERWTAQWLSKHLAKELGIKVSSCHVNRLLKEMGLSIRQVSETAKKKTYSTKDSGITIGDLQSFSEFDSLLSLNLIKTSN
ncbi:helix-turn-helix domain-containing protein [Nostoc sp.]|uniref:helix-turn-helix domain-containing protein n=1 Tax=Nostoc sp. TaxID=1180 RepID=UPI002FF4FCAA